MTGLSLRKLVRNTSHQVDEGVAALITLLVLQPSVDYLPASCAAVLASAAGLLLALSPRSLLQGRRFARSRGFGPIAGFLAWVRIKARHFYDFVALRRIVSGTDDLGSWEISEVNAEAVRRLREAGQSFIVATGHSPVKRTSACTRGGFFHTASPPYWRRWSGQPGATLSTS
jgi:hypothetical protein